MTNYVLIDGENGQPEALTSFYPSDFRVLVFLGPAQKLRPHLEKLVDNLGEQAKIVHSVRSGRNALDLLISYHAGLIAAKDTEAEFWIVSNDRDFDSLIEFLRKAGIAASRWIHAKTPNPTKPDELVSCMQRLGGIFSASDDLRPWIAGKRKR